MNYAEIEKILYTPKCPVLIAARQGWCHAGYGWRRSPASVWTPEAQKAYVDCYNAAINGESVDFSAFLA